VFGTVHAYVPADAAVLATICVQLEPLLVEYSSFTFVTPELVQVMLCELPAVQDSPPFGEVRVTLAVKGARV